MSEQVKPIQKILFGSPGTGKSYQVREIAKNELLIPFDEDTKTLRNTIKTVFHPEYTYADFMGKLLPLTQNGSIIYKFYPGHFLRILGMAYKALIDGNDENFLLVIDELNQGNAAAIFGTVFQLLDRESDGWSSYEVDISDMELFGLLEAMRLNPIIQQNGSIEIDDGGARRSYKNYLENKASQLNGNNSSGSRVCNLLKQSRINIPSNLSIIATINTSDESIYYLDSAFKRRWNWDYFAPPSGRFSEKDVPDDLYILKLNIGDQAKGYWKYYVVGINEFIKSNYQSIRRIEDKQIGWWFIRIESEDGIELQQIKDKLMFYLWDSVFARDKKPLEKFLSNENESINLTQYSDFLALTVEFMDKVYQLGLEQYNDF